MNNQRQQEYLISWVEYPNEDTWESIQNLTSVGKMIEDYEGYLKEEQKRKLMVSNEKRAAYLLEGVKKRDRKTKEKKH